MINANPSADDLRAIGWTIVSHNDYHKDDELWTFYCLTNKETGRYVIGEARTDDEALRLCRIEVWRLIKAGFSANVEAPSQQAASSSVDVEATKARILSLLPLADAEPFLTILNSVASLQTALERAQQEIAELRAAGLSLSSFAYSLMNPGSLPEHIKDAMLRFQSGQAQRGQGQ